MTPPTRNLSPDAQGGPTDADVALAHRLADAAGAAILPFFRRHGLDANNKAAADAADPFDPVTAADRAAERAMRQVLEDHAPNDGVFGEEFGRVDGPSGRLWVLDPIDGTRAFMTGLTCWTVLIALHVEGRTVLGVIDQPYLDERFVGVHGEGGETGASLRRRGEERVLRTRACADLSSATLLTTDPTLFRTGPERDAYQSVEARVRLKRYGQDAYGYAMVAGGWADLVIETGLSPYDIQALAPIIAAAGGLMTDWSGAENPWSGPILVAGDRRVHAEALTLLAAGCATDER